MGLIQEQLHGVDRGVEGVTPNCWGCRELKVWILDLDVRGSQHLPYIFDLSLGNATGLYQLLSFVSCRVSNAAKLSLDGHHGSRHTSEGAAEDRGALSEHLNHLVRQIRS